MVTLLHLGRVAAVAVHDRAQHGDVGGQPADAGALALEVARARIGGWASTAASGAGRAP